jgi:hypothetical protein
VTFSDLDSGTCRINPPQCDAEGDAQWPVVSADLFCAKGCCKDAQTLEERQALALERSARQLELLQRKG